MKKQEQNTKETVSMLVYGYLVILFAGLPLYMQNKLVMIGNAKYLFFRNTTLVLGAFVVLAVLWQRIRGERTTKRTWKKTDVFMLLYLVSAIFSYGISPCREDVLLGYPGWYMGLVTQGLLVGIYFAVSRYYDGSRSIWWIAGITAGIVTLIGLLNRLDIDVLGTFRGMENGEWNRTQLLSTIGNNNWYAGYISVTAGISLAAAFMGKRQVRVLGMIGSFVFFASAITSNSTTAILAACGLSLLLLAVTLAALLLGCLLVAGYLPGSDKVSEVANGRLALWKVTILTYGKEGLLFQIFGMGPDSFYYALYQWGSDAMDWINRGLLDNNIYSNAHNEWLTLLVQQGILGVIAYGGIFLTAFRNLRISATRDPRALAVFFGLTGYLICSLFTFQHVLSTPFAFALLGMAEGVFM